MSWLFLLFAGLLEIVWAAGLESTRGFTRVVPTLVVVAAMVGSMWLLAIATRTIPVGTAYAVWVGIGVAGTAIVGWIALGETMTWIRALCIGGLVAAIVGLKLTTPVG